MFVRHASSRKKSAVRGSVTTVDVRLIRASARGSQSAGAAVGACGGHVRGNEYTKTRSFGRPTERLVNMKTQSGGFNPREERQLRRSDWST
eukprot:4251742-Prymnesium_polylepis.1